MEEKECCVGTGHDLESLALKNDQSIDNVQQNAGSGRSVMDPNGVENSLNQIVGHLNQLFGIGPPPTEQPIRKCQSGAAILFKMILTEIEKSPKAAVQDLNSNTIEPKPCDSYVQTALPSSGPERIPPPLPPRSRPLIYNSWREVSPLVRKAQRPRTLPPRSCLKKTSVNFDSERQNDATKVQSAHVSRGRAGNVKLSKHNSVRFADESTKDAGCSTDLRRGMKNSRKHGSVGSSSSAVSNLNVNTESVTTLSNTISSGYDFLNDVLLSQIPFDYFKKLVGKGTPSPPTTEMATST